MDTTEEDSTPEIIDRRKLIIQLSMGVLIVVTFSIGALTDTPIPTIVVASLAGIGMGARPETFIPGRK